MEIKRPSEINEADIPYIESPFFARARIDELFGGFNGHLSIFGIRGLDELVSEYMDIYWGYNQEKQSAYWAYYKSGGLEKHRDYDFGRDDPVKDQLMKDFMWGDYLIVMHSEFDGPEFIPLFKRDKTVIEAHDQWQSFDQESPFSDYMGFEDILNRIYPKRKRLGYNPYYGSGVEQQEAAQEITLTPEPWPQESTLQQTSLATAEPQSVSQPKPEPRKQPQGPASNDPVFNPQKGIQLARILGAIPAIIAGVLIPDNASLEEEWEVDGVRYKYNADDFSLEITHPDGTKKQVKMYPDGTVTDQQGAILGSVDKEGQFTPVTEQEELDYRIWKANGGDASFAVWKNSGKPLDRKTEVTGASSKRPFSPENAGGPIQEMDYRNVKINHDGIEEVELHTKRFEQFEPNKLMKERLRKIADGEIEPTEYDLRYYTHERRELARYRNIGIPDNVDPGYDVWNNAHTATLEDYGLADRDVNGNSMLYHPDTWGLM